MRTVVAAEEEEAPAWASVAAEIAALPAGAGIARAEDMGAAAGTAVADTAEARQAAVANTVAAPVDRTAEADTVAAGQVAAASIAAEPVARIAEAVRAARIAGEAVVADNTAVPAAEAEFVETLMRQRFRGRAGRRTGIPFSTAALRAHSGDRPN